MPTLIGQFDSPFVRRVGIALTLYQMPFGHEPWSVFADADKIRAFSPLTRVPVLVLDDSESLIDSHSILDHLDSLVPAQQALVPQTGAARRRALWVAALATGIGDKAVSLFYERRLHEDPSRTFVERCEVQIRAALTLLDHHLAQQPTGLWNGQGPGHADIAVACVWRFAQEAHPGLIAASDYPGLAGLSLRLEQTAAFRAICQSFVAPA